MIEWAALAIAFVAALVFAGLILGVVYIAMVCRLLHVRRRAMKHGSDL